MISLEIVYEILTYIRESSSLGTGMLSGAKFDKNSKKLYRVPL